VLVNPCVPLPTGAVFGALGAPPLNAGADAIETPVAFPDPGPLLAFLRDHGNDLEPPARRMVPGIGDVLAALSRAEGCLLARLSGSGPTCYGIFGSDADAARAARTLAHAHPGWWISPTRLG